MARTAPAPNLPPIPGMNPGTFVMGGGGAGGGGRGGRGKGGGGQQGADGQNGGNGAPGSGATAGNCGQGRPGGCPRHVGHASAGDPVDIATGEMFTTPALEFSLPGLVTLDFHRLYNAKSRHLDVGMGFGWCHTFAWEAELHRRRLIVRKGLGGSLEVSDPPRAPAQWCTQGGWRITRTASGYRVTTVDGFEHELDGEAGRFRLARITHPNGATIVIERGRDGAIRKVIDSVGRTIAFAPGPDGRVGEIRLTEPTAGRTITYARYEYDAKGDLRAATNADGCVTRYRYDDDHKIVALRHPSGLTFHYRYDAADRCVETWGELPEGDDCLDPSAPTLLADGQTRARGIYHTKFEFGPDYTEVADSVRILRYFIGPAGIIEKSVGAVSDVYTRTLDDRNNQVALTDALGRTTTYTYDEHDRLVGETDPLGRTLTCARDAEGRPTAVIAFDGGVIDCRYERGNMVEVIDKAGHLTTYQFDERNLAVRKTDPDGGVTRYVSDAHANLVELHMPGGGVWRWQWDYFGRPVERTDPRGGVTRYEYSDAGKLLGLVEPGDRRVQIGWDAMACYTSWVLPDGVRRWRWGGLRWPAAFVAQNGDAVRYRYNREGWLVSVVNERGETARYEYTPSGLVEKITGFDGTWETYKRDVLNRLVAIVTSAGEKLEYEYDEADRVVALTYPDGSRHTCEYDDNDQVVRAVSPGVVVEQDFDAAGNVIAERQIVGRVAQGVVSRTDPMGRRTMLRSSLGFELTSRWLTGGVLASIRLGEGSEVHFEADHAGLPVAERLPGGARVELEWDARLRLVAQRVVPPASAAADAGGRPAPTFAAAYEFGPSDRLARAWSSDRPSVQYQYDGRGRLAARLPDQGEPEAFAFDPTHNLFDVRAPAQRVYGEGNRLIADGPTTYAYNKAGYVIEKRTRGGAGELITRYVWNAQGKLWMALTPDGSQVEMLYDPFGRRIEKAAFRPDGRGELRLWRLVRWVWDGNDPLHEVALTRTAQGTIDREQRTFVPLPGAARLLAVATECDAEGGPASARCDYCISDHLGTPVAAVSDAGAVTARWALSAWGRPAAAEGGLRPPTLFPGQTFDEETGLAYNFHRYYDPETGRFLSPDPSGIAGGLNVYAYCTDPVNWADPWGLEHQCSVSFTPGPPAGSDNPSGTWVPTTDSGRNGPNGNPVPGATSGSTNDDYQPPRYRTQGGKRVQVAPSVPATTRQIAGAQGQNGGYRPPPGQPIGNTDQRNAHTEMHAMEWARTHFPGQIAGSRMNLGGQHPPCDVCNENMRQFTSTTPPATIDYNWPVNNRVRYQGGGGPTAVPHGRQSAVGAEAQRLQQAQQSGIYRNEYLAQMNPRTERIQQSYTDAQGQERKRIVNNPNYNAALIDRSRHDPDDNAQFERRAPGEPPVGF